MAAILDFSLFFPKCKIASIWHQIRNLRPKISRSNIFLTLFHPYLLLAKISQKFGKYVRLTVCLSVGLFVCYVDDNSTTVWDINTKLGQHMYLGCGYRCIVFGVDDIIGYVMRSQKPPKWKIAATQSIFELQQNLKNWNVVLIKGHLPDVVNLRWHI